MEKQAILTDKAPRPIGPYSQAVRVGGFLFLSGQVAIDPASGQFVSGGVGEQTRRVMDNLAAVLEAAGLRTDHIIKTTIFLTDLNDFTAVNEAYGSYFEGVAPARATVQVARLPLDARVEIEAVAVTQK